METTYKYFVSVTQFALVVLLPGAAAIPAQLFPGPSQAYMPPTPSFQPFQGAVDAFYIGPQPDVTVPNTLLHTLLSPPLAGVAHLNRQPVPPPRGCLVC